MTAKRPDRPQSHRPGVPRLAWAAAVGGSFCLLISCAQRRQNRAEADRPPATNAGLATLASDRGTPTIDPPPPDGFDATRRQILESAALLEQMMAAAESGLTGDETLRGEAATRSGSGRSGEAGAARSGDPEPTPETEEGGTRFSLAAFADEEEANTTISDPEPGPELVQGPAEDEQAGPDPTAGAEQVAVAIPPEQRKQQLLDELVGVLGELALSGEGPGASALALAGLETVRPDALDALKSQGVLSEAEVASLNAAQELFRAMSSQGGIADPGEVSAVLDRIRRELDARAGLRITRAELCTRVTGFGRYETFSANRFVAGRAQPVIVYAEVDRFGHRELSGDDGTPRYEIELSQRLELYHVADNLNTWNRAAEVDRTDSRNRVRDYYLINQVTLPANLSIGKYHLKVIMRDLVSGSMAETIIPIEIVAGQTTARPR